MVMNTSSAETNFMKSSHTLSVKSLQVAMNENFKVVVRIRPPLAREITDGRFISTVFFNFSLKIKTKKV